MNTFLEDFYKTMKRIRTFEERVSELFIKGETAGSMLHLSIGEELGPTCISKAMNDNDTFTTHHRGHGIFLARGGDPNKMMAEIAGKKDGYCKGKGGSMHIADMSVGHLGANAIVGGGIPTVVGAGMSYKYFSKPSISVAFFGDGALQQGILYESMNMAALWDLPVVFCCINNQYGMGTKIDKAVAVKDFTGRAKSFGLNACSVNTLDVEEAYYKIKPIIDDARSGKPGFIEIECYRFYGHARMDKSPYRDIDEEKLYRERDPIKFAKKKLIDKNILSKDNIDKLDNEISNEMDEAISFAINASLNDTNEIFKDVYSNKNPESIKTRIKKIIGN
ncbi:MAG: Acetoin:2,6-dichlorophenolindophenol oxidoreductase subunit alpha [Alphaproteobacteria bacterium MarineAlpha5_Bin6]|nr:MAG: Acetoin:2,6-dichlorophenolindophenol oxidoreductase subunit alpha [Alphaproteobacteria bacterium MarineAlpha5_Bin7]PPR54650.1 MAG: Acetoin:2,6-dichlorophenolindophenol oxidoreductase subunit alpha [Alphaproteobacteria bacterium MarineAlpha5_Bin6]|tara:strand:- start:823 stop:1824 length:1002 start_codon:yes stop_codon:yes gene_type:complete